MKRAATRLRDKATFAYFSKLSNIYFDSRPTGANHRAIQRSENPMRGATRMCESPGVARGGGVGDCQVWN